MVPIDRLLTKQYRPRIHIFLRHCTSSSALSAFYACASTFGPIRKREVTTITWSYNTSLFASSWCCTVCYRDLGLGQQQLSPNSQHPDVALSKLPRMHDGRTLCGQVALAGTLLPGCICWGVNKNVGYD